MITFRLDAWFLAVLLKWFITRPAAFSGLGDSSSHIILDLAGAEGGRCCPYLMLHCVQPCHIIPTSPLK